MSRITHDYCDVCDSEITPMRPSRLRASAQRDGMTLSVSVEAAEPEDGAETPPAPDVCADCIEFVHHAALDALVKRRKATPRMEVVR